MKMKEICERTGLTERAVRLYCQRGLLSPETYTQRDRDYLVFNEEDERALRCIAILREADFSLEEIGVMQNEPHLIEKTVREHTARLMRESAEKQELCRRLQTLDPASIRDIVTLAEELRDEGAREVTPRPNVAPLKGQTYAEFCEQGGYCEDEALFAEEERLIRRGRIFSRCFTVFYVISSLLSAAMAVNVASFFLSIAINAVILGCFLWGHSWTRYVLAILQGLGLLSDLYTLTVRVNIIEQWWLLLFLLPIMILEGIAVYFLAFDKGVAAYQYEKLTGGDRYL